eukprot:2683446-Prymnesium_polylepis.1
MAPMVGLTLRRALYWRSSVDAAAEGGGGQSSASRLQQLDDVEAAAPDGTKALAAQHVTHMEQRATLDRYDP